MARMKKHDGDDPRNSINYFVGSAMGVRGEAQRVVEMMDACIADMRLDDGYGLGHRPEYAVEALRRALRSAGELVRDVERRRDHWYRNSTRTNPRRSSRRR